MSSNPTVIDADLPAAIRAAPLRRVARALAWVVASAGSLVLLAWLTLHWGILPHIEQWRPQLEAQASQSLGVPVRIGAISVKSGAWVPAVELRDVVLLDTQQRPALTLPRIAASISARSLVAWELRFAQLLVEGAQLEVRRDAAGRVHVAGFDLDTGSAADDGAVADWFLNQHEIVIRGGTLRWTDEGRGAPPLALQDVQLVLRNGLRRHDLRLDATPDAAWGDRFTLQGRFTQPLLARASQWRRWSGNLHASLPRVDVRELRQQVSLPFELNRGEGALRAWFELKDGRAQAATVDLALRDVGLRLGADLEPLEIAQVEGRLTGQRSADGVALELQRFGFVTGEGLRWPQGDLKLAWRQREGEAPRGGELSAQQLDIDVMAQIAERLPIGAPMRRLLAELNPQGRVAELGLRWDGPVDAPTHYQAKASFTGLSMSPGVSAEPGGLARPGLRNASVQVSATEKGGQARLGVADGLLEFPGVFEDAAVPMSALSAQLDWKIEPAAVAGGSPHITLQVRDARFANADAEGELSATWATGAGQGVGRAGRYPGQLELEGKLTRGLAARTARYLPLGIPEETRRYVERAVRAGTVGSASFRVRGDLWDFPFHGLKSAKDGEFRIAARVEGVTFAYVPGEPRAASPWPEMTQVSGELVFDRVSMEIRNAAARIGETTLAGVKGGIRNLADRPVLALDGSARGPLADMLRFVNATPVGEWTGQALAHASAGGPADLKLALAIPLAELDKTTVKGSVALAGNDLRLSNDTPVLGAARGRVDFSEQGFSVVGASARVLGGDATFEGGSTPDGSLRFSGQGTASAEGLRRAAELGPVPRLAAVLSGQAAYRLTLGFVHGHAEVSLTSTLVGMGSDLPAPLRKSPEAALPLHYETRLATDGPAGTAPARDTLRFELGNLVQAQFQRSLGGDAPKVQRGAIGVLEAVALPAAGVVANLNLAELDLDAWEAAAEKMLGPGGAAEASPPGGYLPDRVGLRVQQLATGSRRITKLVAGLTRDESTWKANVDAEQLNGYVEYRPARAGSSGRVLARLTRLSLPKNEVEQVETLLDQAPATMPALDIVVDDLELRGRRLGRVEVEALNRFAGDGRGDLKDGTREWRVSKFTIANPDAQLSGTGRWTDAGAPPGRRRAVLDFKLALADGGALLERLGKGKTLRGSKGLMSGQVAWLGSPLTIDFPSLTGNVNVAIESGQFLKAEPGAARLLGVLSLQALPRRLALDFRDVFQEGFAFDNVTGDVRIADGVARTNNLRMRGLQAAVLMEGSADVGRETQDLRVVVVPEINAGTASLVYAAINPAVGLGTFLAQAFLRRPLMQAGTREFHVSGSWDDPTVERVERAADAPLPDLDAPTPAAGAASAPVRP